MIIVKLMDGLGNQMFQYAFGRYLQSVYNEPIVFETMKLQNGSYRKLGLQRLSIPLVYSKKPSSQECRFATKNENKFLQGISKFVRLFAEQICRIPMSGADGYHKMIKWGFYTTEDSIIYYPFQKTTRKNIFVRGYFQSEKYFHEIAPRIKEELKVNKIENSQVLALAERMEKEDAVCVHIRRGDYVGNKFFEVCKEDYYNRAIKLMAEKLVNPVFYVFSNSHNDLEWIKENYLFPYEMHFVEEGKDEFDDLYLMYHCKHHIISNSTFSWWGSYLRENSNGITICPARWNNQDKNQDILLDDWIKIPI